MPYLQNPPFSDACRRSEGEAPGLEPRVRESPSLRTEGPGRAVSRTGDVIERHRNLLRRRQSDR